MNGAGHRLECAACIAQCERRGGSLRHLFNLIRIGSEPSAKTKRPEAQKVSGWFLVFTTMNFPSLWVWRNREVLNEIYPLLRKLGVAL